MRIARTIEPKDEHPMTSIARIVAVASLSLMPAMTALAGSAAAQKQLLEVENSQSTKLLQVADDAGFLVKGALDAGTIPASGAGIRLMWYPKKAALRAGSVTGAEWDDNNIGGFSMAFGVNTTANGGNSIALGTQTTASGGNSTALGAQTTASGGNSTAMGSGTSASGQYSTAIGSATSATGIVATAMGRLTLASADHSTAMGLSTKAVGLTSTALGDGTSATGEVSTAMGGATTASAQFSTAMGFRTEASGTYSTAMGFDTHATGVSSTAMGAASTAAGLGSVAMGTRAIAQGAGSFVFADRSSTTQPYTAFDNQFVVRAHGGIGFNSGTNIGCDLPAGVGAWACTSSRLAKEGFEEVDGETVLAKLARIPIQRWSYLGTPAMHVGPMAEDFHGAFGLGEGPTTITTVDADGIALLGVQTLARRTAELRAENAELRAGQAELLRRLEALEANQNGGAR
jgi:trimeric autotransporter adhesin